MKLEEEIMSYRDNPISRTLVLFDKRGRLDCTVLPPDECYSSKTHGPEAHEEKQYCIICGTTLNSYNDGPGCHAHQREALARLKKEQAA